MDPKRGFQALLETIRLWLERADDREVIALHGIVLQEMTKRRLRRNSIPPEESDQTADPSTPPKKNS